MKTMKKVWRYVAKYKKLLTISLSAMLIVQALGLLAPLIVKSIFDDVLINIEKPWNEVSESSEAVYYQGRYFSQEQIGDHQISIVIYEGKYYFIDEPSLRGNKSLEGDFMTIVSQEGVSETYLVTQLESHEVRSFYEPSIRPLTVLLILLAVRFLLQILFTYIQRISTAMINVNIVRDARRDAVAALQRMPMTYFESEPSGKIANRIISDVGGMMNLFQTIMNLLVNATLAVIFAYIGMFYLDSRLALLTFMIFPFVYFWLRYFINKLNVIAVKVNELASLITAQLNEIINGISILQVFNFKKQTEEKFETISKDFMKERIKENILHLSIGWNLIRLIGALVTAVIILYFGQGYLTITGFVVTAGLIYAYNDYLTRLIEPVGTLFREIGNLEHAMVKTERIFKIIDGEQEDGSYEVLPRFKGHVRFDHIWFSYQEGTPVLKGVDLNIEAGELIGLVGHTGSGKSSLMSLLLRFYDMKPYDMGKITVDDVDITTYAKRSFRKHVGIILQNPAIFKGTIADNIRFGLDVPDEKIIDIIHEIGGQKLLDKLEKGIHTLITRDGGNLSVGEKQIISFARAVVHDPAILVMDEATANIDTETEAMIQLALERVRKNRTMIVIAHRLSTIKNANKIVVLENGMKVEEGKHAELLSKNGVYANIYRAQIKTNTLNEQIL
jgi:ATP-binding cassette, subfamily B, multidrug efflux pump